MIREYPITTPAASRTPQNTADPSIAGVKNGRPAIASTMRDHSATAPAPMSPATNPSRRTRVNCIGSLLGKAIGGQYSGFTDPGRGPGVPVGGLLVSAGLRPGLVE